VAADVDAIFYAVVAALKENLLNLVMNTVIEIKKNGMVE
jgi:hypothetical protein